jgi:hypothetical protein
MPLMIELPVSETLIQDSPTATQWQEFLAFRLPSKRFWWDLVYLTILAWLQLQFLPMLLGATVIDLLTPWIVGYLVFAPLNRSALVVLGASAYLETHSLAPAGMYTCIYWVAAVGLLFLKDTFSWSRRGPWITTFLVVELWLVLFEFFLIAVRGDIPQQPMIYLLNQLIRLAIAVIIGMSLFTRESRLRETEAVRK